MVLEPLIWMGSLSSYHLNSFKIGHKPKTTFQEAIGFPAKFPPSHEWLAFAFVPAFRSITSNATKAITCSARTGEATAKAVAAELTHLKREALPAGGIGLRSIP